MSQSTRNTEERTLLEELIPKFDKENNKEICKHVLLDSRVLGHSISNLVPSPDDQKIQIKWLENKVCFRISFHLPVMLLFHVSTRHSKEIHAYFKPHLKDFSIPSAFIPAYNCNLNHLTLLKTHTFERTNYWYNLNRDEESDFICKKLVHNNGGKMIQSSLNFLLQNDASVENVSDSASEVVEKCFQHMYWRPLVMQETSSPYSTIHNMLYNSSTRIHSFHRIYKTIAKVLEIGDKRYSFNFNRKKFTFSYGKILLVAHNSDKTFTVKTNAAFAEPDRSLLRKDDVISCILDRPIFPKLANSPRILITGVVEQPINKDDLKPVIGMSVWKTIQNFDNMQKLCNIGTKNDVRESVLSLLKNNPSIFTEEWMVDFEKRYQTSLKEMFPLVFESDGDVFHLPPPLVSYILAKRIPILDDKKSLSEFVELVDQITTDTKAGLMMKLRCSEVGSKVQLGPCSMHWNSLLRDLPRVANMIYYSRIFAMSPTMVV